MKVSSLKTQLEEEKKENVDEKRYNEPSFQMIGKELGVKIEKEHIDACHRLGPIKGGENEGSSLSLLARQRNKNNLQKGQ